MFLPERVKVITAALILILVQKECQMFQQGDIVIYDSEKAKGYGLPSDATTNMFPDGEPSMVIENSGSMITIGLLHVRHNERVLNVPVGTLTAAPKELKEMFSPVVNDATQITNHMYPE